MTDNERDDQELLEKARHDPDAFTALYHRYLTPVYRYVFIRIGNRHDAEDITSKVFVDALEGLLNRRYHEDGKFASWLFTIAKRRVIDHYRQHSSTKLPEEIEWAFPGQDPFDQVLLSENKTRLSELLKQLDEEKQELVRLRFAGELSFGEIATLEGKSEAAIKMAIRRIIQWLRENWEVNNG